MSTTKFSIPGFTKIAPAIYIQDSQISGALSNYSSESVICTLEDEQKNRFISANTSFSSSSGDIPILPEPATTRNALEDSPPPELIIIASWTGAQSRHVAKYTTAYNSLFPGVPILVLTTVVSDMTIHSTAHKIKSLEPAVHYLLTRRLPSGSFPGKTLYSLSALRNSSNNGSATTSGSRSKLLDPGLRLSNNNNNNNNTDHSSLPGGGGGYNSSSSSDRPFSSILLHAFSEGGSYTSVALASLYLESSRSEPAKPSSSGTGRIPISALVLDSTPGHRPTQSQARRAVARSLSPAISSRPFIAKPLSFAAVSLTTETLKMLKRYAPGKNFFDLTRLGLNDPALFELEGVPRLYLFSEEDEIVMWEDVQSHAEQSGVRSLCVRFKGTRHCQHAAGKGRSEGRIYWEAVRSVWEMREDGGLGVKLMGLGGSSAAGGGPGITIGPGVDHDTGRMPMHKVMNESGAVDGPGGPARTERRFVTRRRRLSLDSLYQTE